MKKSFFRSAFVAMALSLCSLAATAASEGAGVGMKATAVGSQVGGSVSVSSGKAVSASTTSSHGMPRTVAAAPPTVQSTMTRCVKSVSANIEETVCQTKAISDDEASGYFSRSSYDGQGHSSASKGASATSSMKRSL